MGMKVRIVLSALFLGLAFCPSVFASSGNAQNVSVKMGYFNLLQVKSVYPEAAAAVVLEERAKELLRRDVEQANQQLADMQKQNKSKEELDKKAAELQTEIQAKQQAMTQLLSRNAYDANRAITTAVNAVAKERGLDLVIDGAGIYAGGEQFAQSGEDVTELVIKRLSPAAASSSTQSKPETGGSK